MGWFDSYVAFDTETTGLGTSARIVELGAVVFENGVPVHEWSKLLCPEGVDWEDGKVKEALAVNKIARAQLEGQPTFAEALPDLLLELSHDTWVAHNADFDIRMLSQEFARMARPAVLPKLLVCTKNLASHFNKNGGGNRLHDVAGRFFIKQEDAHRATVDAKTCGLVLAAMFKQGTLPADDKAMAALCQSTLAAWKGKHRW